MSSPILIPCQFFAEADLKSLSELEKYLFQDLDFGDSDTEQDAEILLHHHKARRHQHSDHSHSHTRVRKTKICSYKVTGAHRA